MLNDQFVLDISHELVVDLFAGGGGASAGIEQAIGRPVDIAVNHDPDAVGMHEMNHPQTNHYLCDVFEVDPLEATGGRPVGYLHASPDCTHHSQALGGQPRSRKVRSLAWAVHKWVGKTKPKVVTLENVKQMLLWAPLVAKRDKATGRVVRVDGSVAAKGEHVPVNEQWLVPCPKRTSQNWKHFIDGLRAMGATAIQWRVIVNADLGAHSTRERLYVVIRFDGEPIVWPEQTHAKKPKKGQKPWRPAADCIDWSIPGRSIFGRDKPLADATMRRIAHGMRRFVLECPEPFIVPATHTDASNRTRPLSEPMPTVTAANRGELMLLAPTLVPVTHTRDTAFDPRDPLRTITTAKGGETAIASAWLVQAGHGEGSGATKRRSHGVNDIQGPIGTVTASGGGQSLAAAVLVQMGYGEREGQAPRALDLDAPLGTVVAGGLKHGLSTAFMVQANGGFNETHARDLREPMSTVTTKGSQQQLIAAHLTALRRHSSGTDLRDPVATVTAGGEHHALVQYQLSQEHEEGALRCAAFLMRYHGTGGQWADLRDPMTTVTTRDRLALVTVWLKGEPWVIVDICLRMLVPRELYNAQDFPASYVIDRTAAGKVLSKTAQVRMCGNSVSPLPMRLIVAANYCERQALRREAA
jgi:DNA (cytosine-5)-methyltransferase 1